MSEAKAGTLVPGPTKTYTASCHCGKLRYTIDCPSLTEPATQPVNICNCSMCQKYGYLSIYPQRSAIKWVTGYPEQIKKYTFANHVVKHMQCKDCGSPIGMDYEGKVFEGDTLGMNVRMIHNIDLDKTKSFSFDGRNMFSQFNREY